MERDPLVIGENYILPGNEIGVTRPNNNAMIVGGTGSGKSTCNKLTNLFYSKHSNPVIIYAKEHDAYCDGEYLDSKQYAVNIVNIRHPAKSTISFDAMANTSSYADMSAVAEAIVSMLKNNSDSYWNAKARSLLIALIAAAHMTSKRRKRCLTQDVLDMFDLLIPTEAVSGITTPIDDLFIKLAEKNPSCLAVREFFSWKSLPFRTASCVRDTLAAALSTVFPESIRDMMQSKPLLDIKKFTQNKEAIIVIASAVDLSQQYYANLFFLDLHRQLIQIADECPGGELPREIRFIFDDFGCTPISGFESQISLFRSAGISAVMLLQSEAQLEKSYGIEGAAIIRQNCSIYLYYPGGFDDRACEIVSKRVNLPYEDVLNAPQGKVFVMQAGRKPLYINRFDTFHCPEYQEYLKVTNKRRIESVCERA